MTNTAKHGFIVLTATLSLNLSGCSAHDPFIITNTTDSLPVSQSKYPNHHDKVFITQQPLPAGVEFELISTVDVGKIWYGSSTTFCLPWQIGRVSWVQMGSFKPKRGFSHRAFLGPHLTVPDRPYGLVTSRRSNHSGSKVVGTRLWLLLPGTGPADA